MKNILRILPTFLLCAALLAAPGAALELSDPAAPEIAAPSAVLIERETGSVLYARGETDRRPPASVTKVMSTCSPVCNVRVLSFNSPRETTFSAKASG